MASDQCFVTAICGNITVGRTVMVNNGPHKRGTRYTVGNTVNNCQIQGIIIQSFMEVIGKADVENEEKSVNEMDRLDNLLTYSGLYSLTQFFPSAYHMSNCIWAEEGTVLFIQQHNQKILCS